MDSLDRFRSTLIKGLRGLSIIDSGKEYEIYIFCRVVYFRNLTRWCSLTIGLKKVTSLCYKFLIEKGMHLKNHFSLGA